jgi:hypothetical protein
MHFDVAQRETEILRSFRRLVHHALRRLLAERTRGPQDGNLRRRGYQLFQQCQTLWHKLGAEEGGPGDVATGVRQARHQAVAHRITHGAHDNGDRRRRLLCGAGGHCGHGDGDIDSEADKFGREREERAALTGRLALC